MEKSVLVTGGAGFIGSNFIRTLLGQRPDWKICNLDTLTYAGNPKTLAEIGQKHPDRYRFVHGDILDTQLVSWLFHRWRFDYVVHFAAESHVDRSITGPEAFLDTNVTGTFRLLEGAKRAWELSGRPGDFRFLHVSTDEVYGSLGPTGAFSETTPYDPSSPYSASKAASDHFAKAYFNTFDLPVMVTNCSNNYGPFQFPEKLIPLMILNIAEENVLPVYGDGKNVRDWLYVTDHCEALLKVIEAGKPGESYNIGGGVEQTNLQIVHRLCDMLDDRLRRSGKSSSRRLIRFVADRLGHDRRYAIDPSKIRDELGWSPRYSFLSALEETVDWYLANMAWVTDIQSGEYRNWTDPNGSGRCFRPEKPPVEKKGEEEAWTYRWGGEKGRRP